ncbi:MAG: hypothetical protein WCV58_01525 [Patescibacteria group bacterium]
MDQKQPQPQKPNTQSSSEDKTPQQSKNVSFWKSTDPLMIVLRIVIYLFVGIPLMIIILGGVLAIMGSSRKNAQPSTAPTVYTSAAKTPNQPSSSPSGSTSSDAYNINAVTDYQKQTGFTPTKSSGILQTFSSSDVTILEEGSGQIVTFKISPATVITDGTKQTNLTNNKVVQIEYEGFNPSNALRIWMKN